jgi:hypothetical protein
MHNTTVSMHRANTRVEVRPVLTGEYVTMGVPSHGYTQKIEYVVTTGPDPVPSSDYEYVNHCTKATGLGIWIPASGKIPAGRKWSKAKRTARKVYVPLGYAEPEPAVPVAPTAEEQANALAFAEAVRRWNDTTSKQERAELHAEHVEMMRQAEVSEAYLLRQYRKRDTEESLAHKKLSKRYQKNRDACNVVYVAPEVIRDARSLSEQLAYGIVTGKTFGSNAKRTKKLDDGKRDTHFRHQAQKVERDSTGRILRKPVSTTEGTGHSWMYCWPELSQSIESHLWKHAIELGKPYNDGQVKYQACRDAAHEVFTRMRKAVRVELAVLESNGYATTKEAMTRADGTTFTPDTFTPDTGRVSKIFAAVREYWIKSGSRKWESQLAKANDLLSSILACDELPDTEATRVKLSRLIHVIRTGWEMLGYEESVPSLPRKGTGRPATLTV